MLYVTSVVLLTPPLRYSQRANDDRISDTSVSVGFLRNSAQLDASGVPSRVLAGEADVEYGLGRQITTCMPDEPLASRWRLEVIRRVGVPIQGTMCNLIGWYTWHQPSRCGQIAARQDL
jgi:hypothetical protein